MKAPNNKSNNPKIENTKIKKKALKKTKNNKPSPALVAQGYDNIITETIRRIQNTTEHDTTQKTAWSGRGRVPRNELLYSAENLRTKYDTIA